MLGETAAQARGGKAAENDQTLKADDPRLPGTLSDADWYMFT